MATEVEDPKSSASTETSGGEQKPVQPTVEELQKQLAASEAQKTEAIREMNERMRLAAEREKEVETLRLQFQQTQAMLANQRAVPDPLTELDNQIQQLEEAGEYSKARLLERQRSTAIAQAIIQQNSQAQINAFANMVELNPVYTPETKVALKELFYRDGKPELGINPKMAPVLQQAALTGTLSEVLDMAESKAIARNVKTGKTKTELFQEWTAESEKRKKEAELATSLTQGVSGTSPTADVKEKARVEEDDFNKRLQGAEYPL